MNAPPDLTRSHNRWWRSPLTDPRSVASSLAVHALLLAIASAVILRAGTLRPEPTHTGSLQGEIEATDNRASDETGGGAEASGATGVEADVAADRGVASPPTRDPAADDLLADILQTRPTAARPVTETLPGPALGDLGGLTGGPGAGGALGSGSGTGTGLGPSTGPGTEFFGMRDNGRSYAYVIDRSGSMVAQNSLDVAKRELLTSLAKVPAEARFALIFYNLDARLFPDPSGRAGLMAASPANKERVRSFLATVQPAEGTDHMRALRAAIALRPEVIFFLTDADLMTRQDVAELRAEAGKIRIQVVEFGQTGSVGGSAPLKTLAQATGGSYRYINVNTFGP